MLVIDPLGNHIAGANTDAEGPIRDAIARLNDLADELDCLLVGVRHPKKDRRGGALASVLGSTAWVDVPRAVVMIAPDDEADDLHHIEVVAGNRSRRGQAGRIFRIEGTDAGHEEPITKAIELGVSTKPVDTLLGPASNSAKARSLILMLLESGPVESDQLDAQVAERVGLSARTVRDIRMTLGKEGRVRSIPEKDEQGAVQRWLVARTNAA
jgi:hypothetical protein